ncbi:hypothetical protein OAT67_06075 [Bacteriovoracaceae bacterium]|nr:hypothetical protein [Bacteriovoracaceae bacterium]
MRNLITILTMLITVNTYSADGVSYMRYSDSKGDCLEQNLEIELNTQNIGDISKPVEIALHSGAKAQETIKNDPRKVFKGRNDKKENHWMQAVGKAFIPEFGDNDNGGNCSTSLVTEKSGVDANIIVLAGHCLRKWFKNGQTNNEAEVTFTTLDGVKVKRKFSGSDVILRKYSTDYDDYAIVKLDKPISRNVIKPLIASNQRLGYLMEENPNLELMTAGYHGDKDPKFGNSGKNLTYQKCKEMNAYISHKYIGTTCVSYRGGSGSPLVAKVDREGPAEQEKGDEYLFVGSLVGAARDGHYITQFANHAEFGNELFKAIQTNRP